MNLPRDPKTRVPVRAALIAAVCALTAANAGAAAFLVSRIVALPRALAPGDRLPAEFLAGARDERSVILALGDESPEDYWAMAAVWEVEHRAPGSTTVAVTARRDSVRDEVPRALVMTDAVERWVRRRLPVLPALLFVESGRIAAAHPAPLDPGLSGEIAERFLRGGSSSADAPGLFAADTTSPLAPGIPDAREVIRDVRSDPVVEAFLARHRARSTNVAAALHYMEGTGYFWRVEIRVGECGCSSGPNGAVARLLVRPSDGAILAREFHAEAALAERAGAPRPPR